jgi:uncharacterized protein YndB with AHSA1/START domain
MSTTREKTLNEAIVLERTYDAPANQVWDAITNKEKMKQWYFDIKEFRPEVGFNFQFVASDGKRDYLHLCVVKEVIPQKKLSYSWKYDYDPGISVVTFELFPEGNKTKLRLTHEGIDNFSKDHPELEKKNFENGWNDIINKNLKEFLEK